MAANDRGRIFLGLGLAALACVALALSEAGEIVPSSWLDGAVEYDLEGDFTTTTEAPDSETDDLGGPRVVDSSLDDRETIDPFEIVQDELAAARTGVGLGSTDLSDLPAGLDPEGLQVDGDTHFLPTPSARRVFDLFFDQYATFPLDLARARAVLYVLDALPPAAADECAAVLDRYAALVVAERGATALDGRSAAERRIDYLGPQLATALYGKALGTPLLARATAVADPRPAVGPSAPAADWQDRLQAYRAERDRVRGDRSIDYVQREDALEALRERYFDASEIARVRASDRIDSLGP